MDRQQLTPVFSNGVFRHPWSCPDLPGVVDLLRWMTMRKNRRCFCNKLHSSGPHFIPDFQSAAHQAIRSGLSVCWLGHSTLVTNFGRTSFITDPVFAVRCSPIRWFGPKRIAPLPCTVAELPELEAVLISHNHYDHLDLDSVRSLNERFKHSLRWFVPQGLGRWMTSVGCVNVKEMTWFTECDIVSNSGDRFRVICLPCQHWSSRSLFDRNKSLWCSWAVIGKNKRFYFAGDTGYCSMFETIGQLYGPFDLAAIPIGCYEPRWFMKMQHVDPEEAILIHQNVRSKASIGIHWGTYDMGALEHFLEPPCKLAAARERAGISEREFFTLAHGAVWNSDSS